MHMFGRLAPVLAALLLLSACAGSGDGEYAKDLMVGGEGAAGTRDARPTSLGELQHYLSAELARLGKSISDTAAHAPTGDANAVFDLAAEVVDPDGPPEGIGGGELPPTGVALAWTERLLGDYDMNGQVNLPDLVPLASHWLGAVGYDAAALHGGIAYWPAGGAEDDGGSPYPAPPAAGSGAANWRFARTDGDGNGQLYFGDVTTIAQHWKEQSSGYRVYVKLPGATEYQLLPADGGAPEPPAPGVLTLARSAAYPTGATQPDPTRPMRFRFTCTADGGHGGPPHGDESTPLPEGHYAFYVAAYDVTSDAEGPACGAVEFDIAGGIMNQLPEARLSLSPNFAGAPAVIAFDASASTDADGSIVEYRWDFDADGVVDWSTTDASVPDKSSGGEVDTITPGAAPGPGLPPTSVTVTYHQGYDHYLYPRVTVVDDNGWTATSSQKLGVSGWVHEVISSELPEFDPPGDEVRFNVDSINLDPATNEVCLTGRGTNNYGDAELGLWFGRRKTTGVWEQELICPLNSPFLRTDSFIGFIHLAWQSNGQPLAILNESAGSPSNTRVLMALRQADGTWDMAVVRESAVSYGVGANDVIQLSPGELEFKLAQSTGATTPGGMDATHYYVAHWQDGALDICDTGWDTESGAPGLGKLTLDHTGLIQFAVPHYNAESPHELWRRRRLEAGNWVDERLDAGLPVLDNQSTNALRIAERADGLLGIAVERYWHYSSTNWHYQMCVAVGWPGAVSLIPLRDDCDSSRGMVQVFDTPVGFSIFTSTRENQVLLDEAAYHDMVDASGNVTSEMMYQVYQSADLAGISTPQAVWDSTWHCYAVSYVSGGEFVQDNGEGTIYAYAAQLLYFRVDPRIP